MSRSLRELYESSPFSNAQTPYLEERYERYLADSASITPEGREFFSQFGARARTAVSCPIARPAPAPPRKAPAPDSR